MLPVAYVRYREAVAVVVPGGTVLRPAAALVEPPGPRIGVKHPQRRLGVPGGGEARECGGHQAFAKAQAPHLGRDVNLPDLSDHSGVFALVAGWCEAGKSYHLWTWHGDHDAGLWP